ncbi:unnamed protein product [Callosobruchus maculatus]|uniref:Major facilitator superfamily (MFS) profile domain-containing protein n=1 Tax=Callosobruchus maculatus TaxID=64391 RepID=A0A653CC73_CALMS|nr:unnamed protein product [Callosobruchus maculatus]
MKFMWEIGGRRKLQYMASLSATLCVLSSEMHFGWTSPSLPVLISGQYFFTISQDEASWLAVILLAGTVVGAFFAGSFANILGRKKMVLLTAVPLLIAWLMIALASNVKVLFAARFIAGMSSGLCFSTIPMYLGEVSEPDIRGMLSSLGPVCVVLGILLINIIGNYLPIDTAAYISSSFPIVLFLTFLWMPESPSYLLQQNQTEAAKRALVLLRGPTEGEKELYRLLEYMKTEPENKANICDLVRDKVNRKAAIVAYGLRTIQQLCGITVITFYCKTIFEDSKEILSPNISTILYFLVQLMCSFASTFVVDKIGRKPLLIISLVGASTALLVLTMFMYTDSHLQVDVTNLKYIPFACLMINVAFISIGVRVIPLLMMGEMFSARIKPLAVCVGAIYYSLIAMLVAKLYHVINELYGSYLPFLMFTLLGYLSILFVAFIVPETKGKNLEDIQRDLGGKASHNIANISIDAGTAEKEKDIVVNTKFGSLNLGFQSCDGSAGTTNADKT